MGKAELLQLTEATQTFASVTITGASGDGVTISYSLPPGAQASEYGCYVAIWQDGPQIPWENKPKATKALTHQSGAVSIDTPIQDKNYIVGLSVGPVKEATQKNSNMAASSYGSSGSSVGGFRASKPLEAAPPLASWGLTGSAK